MYSQYIIGLIYNHGIFIDFNVNKSFHYLKLSADQNHPDAQILLANLYQIDDFFDQDKVIKYLNLAVNQKHLLACTYLGCMYKEGEKIEQFIFTHLLLIKIIYVLSSF